MPRDSSSLHEPHSSATLIAPSDADGNNEIDASLILDRVAAPAGSTLPLPRLLVFLAHPDDEVIALGGRLERLRRSTLLCCTDGAPANGEDARVHGFSTLDAYRQARRGELGAALRLAELPETCARPLLIQQATGQLHTIADQTAIFHLVDMTRAIMQEIELNHPEAVLTHPYEGGHPDHDSCAFAVHAAVRLLSAGVRPLIVEAAFYHAGESGIRTNEFLSGRHVPQVSCRLSAAEQERKRDRLACFRSQRATLAQFALDRELFRIAPDYDFTRPPHIGRLFYEVFPWGVSAEKFRELVTVAFADLALAPTDDRAGYA